MVLLEPAEAEGTLVRVEIRGTSPRGSESSAALVTYAYAAAAGERCVFSCDAGMRPEVLEIGFAVLVS